MPVGSTGAYSFQLCVPGALAAAAGVTWVSVLPTHRRRGIMGSLMRRQLDDIHDRGEPIAVLWASEAGIYAPVRLRTRVLARHVHPRPR